MDAEVFSQPEFLAYARENLVLVKVDYPRTLPQPAQVKQQNKQLEKQYQIGGYPTVIILNSRGKTIGELGYKEGGAKAFVNRLKRL
jgi:protein disulfide-isomerase